MAEGIESEILSKIAVPTKDFHLEAIQEVLYKVRTYQSKQIEDPRWNEILGILWKHLQTGFVRFDDQLLCSVCFYTTLLSSNEKELYLNKIFDLIKSEVSLKIKLRNEKDQSADTKTLQVVSLMYGLLQSKFIIQVSPRDEPKLVNVLSHSLELLLMMAYEYSKYTFIVFKMISSFKIVSDTDLQYILFPKRSENILALRNLTNHNWENPITGVRDLNKSVFQMVVSMGGSKFRHAMIEDIDGFYWNKAKYLMLAILIEHPKKITLKSEWIDGLMYSLSKPGLVSAGADMYYAIINKMTTKDEWCSLFLSKVIVALCGEDTKSIENFCNYWCLTTFKKFPDLSKIIMNELNSVNKSFKNNLLSILCILKQANKLGLLNKWNGTDSKLVETIVLSAIDHCDSHIRMLAFEIITVTVGKCMPSEIEYKLVLDYLINNINSDCTVLRISMLGNMKCFLTNLCASYLNFTKHNKSYSKDELQDFYKNLQIFLIESLNLDGNYQRKSSTIKLCNVLLSSLTEATKKRQKQKTAAGNAMLEFLMTSNCLLLFSKQFLSKLFDLLKDPADDIRETTVQLLLEHYSEHITPPLINLLIENAKYCIRSKFFFDISCGQSMFRLIASLTLKKKCEGTVFANIDELFEFGYDVLNKEYEIKRDIVKSIEDGKQMHAYLGILQVVLKASKEFSHELHNLRNCIPQLLKILEFMSNQFALEEEPAVSSDFSKMSNMVEDIIASSGYNPLDEKDAAKISGLHQIVLNCLWLNVKASCDFASYLITLQRAEEDAATCERCLGVITHVLETSRHKGAIEAAGAALGRAVQYLSGAEAESLRAVPARALRRRLRGLVSQASASVTRRGAGLSIMLHRIVSSDVDKEKPLFHYFMEVLLQTCNSDEGASEVVEQQKDVPRAIYIHLLTRVVTDSSLASDVMHYSADLAEIAFGNLTSPHWQIRNAALQLYGALVPKLIGQKKASGAGDETAAAVALHEFVTHFPRLAQYVTASLKQIDAADPVESHSNLLPVINLLANLAKRYKFTDEITFSTSGIFESLLVLLGSPIYAVRRLTAKCLYNTYDYRVLKIIFEKLQQVKLGRENLLHGSLMLVTLFNKHLPEEHRDGFAKILDNYFGLFKENHSYVCRREFEKSYKIIFKIEQVLQEAKQYKQAPGVSDWANNRMRTYILSCPWDEIPEALRIIMKENDYEIYCDFVLHRIETEGNPNIEILIEMSKILLEFENLFKSNVIWKILYNISLQVDSSNIDISMFQHLLDCKKVPYRIRYVIPYLASVADVIPDIHLESLSDLIFSLCDPDKEDVDMRYIAALANNELAKIFYKLPDSIKICAIKCAVLLLQDEDEDVRIINVHFYSCVKINNELLNPYVCLAKILNRSFLQSCLADPEQGISALCDELLVLLPSYAKPNEIDEYNPFSNYSKNIYFEAEVVKKLIENVK